jgi:uncharacterized protein (TIGR01319 family)
MTDNALRFLIDFGSTFTKLVVVDLDAERIVARYQAPSSVATDITVALRHLFETAEKETGAFPSGKTSLVACSSAAGGLRMVTVGLVPSLSSEAGVRAALGAGAKVVKSFSFNLSLSDVEAIQGISPDIILLIGGTDGGDTKVITHNAAMLSRLSHPCPIVVAGNHDAVDEVQAILFGSGRTVVFADNVMPQIGTLSVDACREAIRQIFVSHIVKAKGIDRALELVDDTIIPTPSAVMKAATLLADGRASEEGLGELLVVDVGGATTDVYSVAKGYPSRGDAMTHGLPEPYAKRTVEGDLGVRHNIETLVELGEARRVFEDASPEEVLACFTVPSMLPQSDFEYGCDTLLASVCVDIAGERHCGKIRMVFGPMGEMAVQEGKDLTGVRCVIGTGGPLVFSRDPAAILGKMLFRANAPHVLRPKEADLRLDANYVFYAMGLLSASEPGAALRLLKHAIKPL